MTLRTWLIGAAWVWLCATAALCILGGIAVAAGTLVLAPFALIGFLVGAASNLNLGRVVPHLALWLGAMALAGFIGVFACQRCVAFYRATQAQTPPWPRSLVGSSIAAGLLASSFIGLGGVSVVFAPSTEQRSREATWPTTDEDRLAFAQTWLPRAKAGDAYAQFVVGQVFQEGLMGQAVDHGAALVWLKQAAAQGDPDATLSLLVAQRLGSLGSAQQFDIEAPLAAHAAAQTGWRRAAVELILADNPPVVVGGGAPDPAAAEQRSRRWLEKAALSGSRYAAFRLARSLELARDADQRPAPELAGAMRWYAFAGAHREVERLQQVSGEIVALADPPARRETSPSPDELARLKRRADMVAVRQRATVVSMATDDALAHFIMHAEASENYTMLAEAAMQASPSTRLSGDTRLAVMYYLLASKHGDAAATAKLRDMGVTVRE